MTRDPSASVWTMVGRAIMRRCPRCGTGAFESYFALRNDCLGCGLRYEREEGYWVGALIVNTMVAFGSFIVLFVGGIILTWPDVPWGGLMILSLGVMAALPVLFYPLSKTIWMALELSWHPLEDKEVEEAALRVAGP